MTYQAAVYDVLIASPSDVNPERNMIRDAIHNWNSVHSRSRGIVLMPVAWETHAIPAMGDRPQAIINKQLAASCDILIAAFWTKLGTPTGVERSGTVEEIKEHVNAGKPAMIYFSKAPVVLESVDINQYASLREFKTECQSLGVYCEYESLTEFGGRLNNQPARQMNSIAAPLSANVGDVILPPSVIPNLSDEAKSLLLAAGKTDGYIVCSEFIGGWSIFAGDQPFGDSTSTRSFAMWRGAVSDLEGMGLIRDAGNEGEIYQLTREGYQLCDTLTAK